MDFPEPMHVPSSAPEEAEPFSPLPTYFLEDALRVSGVEMPTEWDSSLLDEWVNTDLLYTDDLMNGIEYETSEPAAVAGSPDLIDFAGLWPQDSLPEPMDSRLNHSVSFDARYEVPERNIPRVNNQVETTQARRRIKCAEWDDKRPLITSLYIDQENSLSQTRKILADDHGFHASEKAYKDKIREWRLVKNLKRRQIIYMLKIARKRRDEQGKATTFFYRGNRVPEAKMRRYSNTMTTTSTIDTVPSNVTFITPGNSETNSQQRSSREILARTSSAVQDSLSPPLSSQAAHGLGKDELAVLNLKRTIIEAYEARFDDDEWIEIHGGKVSTALKNLRLFYFKKACSTPASLAELAKFCLSQSFVQEVPVIRKNWYSVDRRLFATPVQIWQAQCLIAARRFSEGDVLLDMVLQEYEHIGFPSEAARLKKVAPLTMLLAKASLAQRKFYTLEQMLQSVIRNMDEQGDEHARDLLEDRLSLRKMLCVCQTYRAQVLNDTVDPLDKPFVSLENTYELDSTLVKDLMLVEIRNGVSYQTSLWALSMLDVLRYRYDRGAYLEIMNLGVILRKMRSVACSGPLAALTDRVLSAGDDRTQTRRSTEFRYICKIFSRMLDSYRRVGTLDKIGDWEFFLRTRDLVYTQPHATLENLSETDYAIRIMGPSFTHFLEEWPPIELPNISEARRTSFPFPERRFHPRY